MNHLSEAWWLTKRELKSRWLSFLLTMVFNILFGLAAASGFYAYVSGVAQDTGMFFAVDRLLVDFVFVLLTLSLGSLFVSREYMSFGTIREEPFLKQLSFYRSLPIPVRILALNRMLFMLITLGVMSVVFYLVFISLSWNMIAGHMSVAEFVSFILFWLGYSLAFGGFYPYLEFGTNGKVLIMSSFLTLVAFIPVWLFFVHVLNIGLVEGVIHLIRAYTFWPALISICIGCTSFIFWKKVLERRFKKGDLP